ncbi:MAG: ABC transporter ATP-binding protein [Clostridia bacterium]|nr:ABC transporter ATP-binding protein [Clostridia bacterium]
MYTYKWVWQNFKGYHGRYITALVMQIVISAMVVVTPSITGRIIDRVVVGVDNGSGVIERHPEELVTLILLMIAVHYFRMGASYLMIVLFEQAAQGMKVSLRTYLYEKLQSLDMSYYSKSRSGDLMTRLTGDLDMVRHFSTNVIRMLTNAVVIYVAAIIYLFTINWKFTLILVLTSPLFMIARNRFSKTARPLFRATRDRLTELNGFAQENIESNRVVKAFAKEEYECERFDKFNVAFRDANLKATFTWLKFYPLMETFSQSLGILITFFGGLFCIWGDLSIGQLAIYLSLSWAISNPMSTIGMLLNDFERFLTSANKVMELYYANSSIVNPKDPYKKDEKPAGRIDFDHVTFAYDSNVVLRDIDFHLKPGETLAIMGPTGSGKTTIASLIGRFFDVKEGSVKIDGVDVRKYDLAYLRSNIGMATQDVFLFSETVDSNIAYGDEDLPEEDVKKFAVAADADSFIRKMPDGYSTIVGERGIGLSGGQRQRIALARALAVRPSILILDDTTSAVDVETEQYIWNQLAKDEFKCTRIVIANRVSSVRDADQILILNADGSIRETGSHDELMEKKGYYYETFMLQNEGIMSGVTEAASEGGAD